MSKPFNRATRIIAPALMLVSCYKASHGHQDADPLHTPGDSSMRLTTYLCMLLLAALLPLTLPAAARADDDLDGQADQ